VRDNPVAAASGGLNRGVYTVASLGLSGVYAGIGGALLAINLGRIDPGTFPLRLSLLLAAGAAVCGLGSVWGAPVAALLVGYLTDLAGLLPHIGKHRPGPTTFFFGAAVIVLVVGRGLATAVADRGRARRAAR
jgi:branched-chain amino acid transport system permease protein